ncbi:hypothetical protein C0584_05305 [Candidatus Parcubacteria bacterium]|nr:MAG: hypothetical protein C0584_05305 [Candidatus Parcubacteria bacterium]
MNQASSENEKYGKVKLTRSLTFEEMVLDRVLDGIKVEVEIKGEKFLGTLAQLTLTPGVNGRGFALLNIDPPGGKESDNWSIMISISKNNGIIVMPKQPQENQVLHSLGR